MALCKGVNGKVCNHAVLVDGMICVRCEEERERTAACTCGSSYSSDAEHGGRYERHVHRDCPTHGLKARLS